MVAAAANEPVVRRSRKINRDDDFASRGGGSVCEVVAGDSEGDGVLTEVLARVLAGVLAVVLAGGLKGAGLKALRVEEVLKRSWALKRSGRSGVPAPSAPSGVLLRSRKGKRGLVD